MTTASVTELNPAKAEAFAGKMLGILNGATTALMSSIGHRTGLFDTMSGLKPSTSTEIADASQLNERYVREWLGNMVTSGIVEYNPAEQTYFLPPEHAGFLTRAAGPDNMTLFCQYISLFGNVENEIVECFRHGGGVPYDRYQRFQALMAEESAAVNDLALIDRTLPLVPGLVARLEQGIQVADVGCGQGHALNLMARAFPRSHFKGYDFSEEGVAAAQAEAQAWDLDNVRFQVQDIANWHEAEVYDFITAFDTIHDQAHPTKVLQNIYTALKPGSPFLMIDIAASSKLEENIEHPLGPVLYTASTMHCMTVSLAYGGEGLGTAWGRQKATEMLEAAGFHGIEVKEVEGDILNYYYVSQK
ncbi:MAG: class I SAM-dependent methyltransferase [Candidatus Sericytochromatia bacterium]